MSKWLLIATSLSFLPIWRDVSTGKGQNIWQYIYSTAFTQRKHISVEEAIANYRRNMGYE